MQLSATLQSLRACEGFNDSPVYVFADGPKTAAAMSGVEDARSVARATLGNRATYVLSDRNKGLAQSIIDGVGQLTRDYGRAIIVEDDLVLAPEFLTFINGALDRYADDEGIYQVSGHMFDVPEFAHRRSAVMLPFTTTWGWATWARAWQHFDAEASGWQDLRADRALRHRFNLEGTYDYLSMMEAQAAGLRNSWGIRWYWCVFKRGGLSVFPPRSLVRNDGFDGSGTHGTGMFRKFGGREPRAGDGPIDYPERVLVEEDYAAVRRAVWRQNGGSVGKVVDLAKKAVRRITRR